MATRASPLSEARPSRWCPADPGRSRGRCPPRATHRLQQRQRAVTFGAGDRFPLLARPANSRQLLACTAADAPLHRQARRSADRSRAGVAGKLLHSTAIPSEKLVQRVGKFAAGPGNHSGEWIHVGLAYQRVGTGVPLVLLHGIGHRRQAWDAVLPLLASHRELIPVDLPGHGESPPLAVDGRSVSGILIQEIVGLLDELGLDRPHVAGCSLGGLLALEIAASGRAASVTALSPAGFWTSIGELRYAVAVNKAMQAAGQLIRPLGPALSRSTAGRALIYALIVAKPSRVRPEQAWGDMAAFLDSSSAMNMILAAATPFAESSPRGSP